jgi:hypothetical protein
MAWLLLEVPGSWPPHALDALDPALARALSAKAADHGARVSLIRRPGRHPRADGPQRWAFADLRTHCRGIRWADASTLDEVLHAAWQVEPGEGEPLALVCAHSRHDVCCAVRGRPAAAALERAWPGRVWECSHLGGDRFAPTAVVLPTGLCYGRIDTASGAGILAAHDEGMVVPAVLRGACTQSRPVQAAQAAVRARDARFLGIDALSVVHERALAEGRFAIRLVGTGTGTRTGNGTGTTWDVVVEERVEALGGPATCRATAAARVTQLVAVEATQVLQ